MGEVQAVLLAFLIERALHVELGIGASCAGTRVAEDVEVEALTIHPREVGCRGAGGRRIGGEDGRIGLGERRRGRLRVGLCVQRAGFVCLREVVRTGARGFGAVCGVVHKVDVSPDGCVS